MPATRNEATRRWKPPKVTPFAELFIRHGHTALTRTVADIANGCTTSSENSKTFQNFQPDRQNPKLTLN